MFAVLSWQHESVAGSADPNLFVSRDQGVANRVDERESCLRRNDADTNQQRMPLDESQVPKGHRRSHSIEFCVRSF